MAEPLTGASRSHQVGALQPQLVLRQLVCAASLHARLPPVRHGGALRSWCHQAAKLAEPLRATRERTASCRKVAARSLSSVRQSGGAAAGSPPGRTGGSLRMSLACARRATHLCTQRCASLLHRQPPSLPALGVQDAGAAPACAHPPGRQVRKQTAFAERRRQGPPMGAACLVSCHEQRTHLSHQLKVLSARSGAVPEPLVTVTASGTSCCLLMQKGHCHCACLTHVYLSAARLSARHCCMGTCRGPRAGLTHQVSEL